MNKIFQLTDIKKYIFKYLRKKPKIVCVTCRSICIWDKEIIEKFVTIPTNDFTVFYKQCYKCHYSLRDFF